MSYYGDVDCDICRNKNMACTGCIHDMDREDYFDPLNNKEISELEAKRLESFIEGLKGEKVDIALDARFKERFNQVSDFRDKDTAFSRPEFWNIFCAKDSLQATNGFMLANIKANIPEALVYKQIIAIDDSGIWLSKGPFHIFTDGKAEGVLEEGRTQRDRKLTVTKQSLGDYLEECPKEVGDPEKVVRLNGGPALNQAYLDHALAIIGDNEEFTVSYREPSESTLLQGNDIEIIILPLRHG